MTTADLLYDPDDPTGGCEIDGNYEDSSGGRQYWHCRCPAAMTVLDGSAIDGGPGRIRLCAEHYLALLAWLEEQ